MNRPPPTLYPKTRTRIGFSTPKSWNPLSAIVRWFTGSRASHAWFLYWDDDFQMDMVLEAHEMGLRLLPFAAFERKNNIVKIVQPRYDIETGLVEMGKLLGTMYDFAGLVGMVVVLVGRSFKRRWKNPFRSPATVFCSEGVARAMLATPGYNGLPWDPETVDPETLIRFFETEESAPKLPSES